jgi:AmmeMemoRadiSam system protein A
MNEGHDAATAADPHRGTADLVEANTCLLDASERAALMALARASIEHGLEHDSALAVNLDTQPERLCAQGAVFVTLHREGRLRGCIGHLQAESPLAQDVAENAYAAAFRDPRFPPLTDAELNDLDIQISVLTAPEAIAFASEAELLAQLRPGIDGVILAENDSPGARRGTFLPSVWEQLPRRQDFLRHLKLKAGLSPDHWSKDIRAWRYRTESFDA